MLIDPAVGAERCAIEAARAVSRIERNHPMPTIGSFSQDDLFGQEGVLETATLKAKVKFVPLRERTGNQPDYRILSGKRELGAAWSRTSKKNPTPATKLYHIC